LKRGIETGGSKADKLLALEEYIRAKENLDPRSIRFGEIDETSAQVPKGKTSVAQTEVDSDKSLINQCMEQMLDRLEGLETTVDKQQLSIDTLSKSVERLERG